MRQTFRWTLRLLAVLVGLLMAAVVALWFGFRASLPMLDGEHVLPGLSAAATIERDGTGVASVRAEQRLDLARALGYLHAQERYFEMDLSRRAAAGELAALLGPRLLDIDRRRRLHRFRSRVDTWWPNLPETERAQLQAYTEGVNAGLDGLRARPWPYLLLRSRPEPWQVQDSLLVVLAMFFDLQDQENLRERRLDTARRHLPESVVDFIARPGTAWDAPIQGLAMPEPPVPDAATLDLRNYPPATSEDDDATVLRPEPELPGSNNFAVSGRFTTHGRALVANDMHLGLRVPTIWFRARLEYGMADARVRVDGYTLPGVPAVVVGSNGNIAWAFTNAYGDWLDLVRIETDPDDSNRYRSADGWQSFQVHEEVLMVAGRDPETLIVRDTVWGPVITDDDEPAMALVWTAHRQGSVNTELLALEHARDVDAAIAIAARAGIPAQNFVVGDHGGRLAWTIAGRIPQRRSNHDPTRPIDGARIGDQLWLGWLDPSAYPRIVDPASGRLWTANTRVVDGNALALLGDGSYDNGARAGQIRDRLFAREHFDEAALLAIQLDDRALFLEPWWRLLREVLEQNPGDVALTELSEATSRWSGCACVDSADYRLVRAFRSLVHETVMRGLSAPILAEVASFEWPRLGQNEGVVWQLLRERPVHLLPPPHESWDALLLDQARRVQDELAGRKGGLRERTWGEVNTVRIRHPVGSALPGPIARWFDMPAQALPGDSHLPRVQGVQFGASQRMVVAPGLEDQGISHIPAGNSGHPMSPYFGAGHDDWTQGRPSPMTPGATRWRLHLFPDPEPGE